MFGNVYTRMGSAYIGAIIILTLVVSVIMNGIGGRRR